MQSESFLVINQMILTGLGYDKVSKMKSKLAIDDMFQVCRPQSDRIHRLPCPAVSPCRRPTPFLVVSVLKLVDGKQRRGAAGQLLHKRRSHRHGSRPHQELLQIQEVTSKLAIHQLKAGTLPLFRLFLVTY